MSASLQLSPLGHLSLSFEEGPGNVEDEALRAAFASSIGAGLESLAGTRFYRAPLTPELAWLRELAHAFFTALCHRPAPQAAASEGPAAPGPCDFDPPSADPERLAAWVDAAPPFFGIEYLDTHVLSRAWNGLAKRAGEAVAGHPEGLAGYLRALNPAWHAVGRVTFHLAENKRQPAFPFAFLATYTHGLNAAGAPQHWPLGRALQEYAGAGRRDALARLLEPVQRAAENSPLARELLEARTVFQPQPWTPAQAYRFLREIPRLEESGLAVRIPDWWKAGRPPRPQVRVRVGETAGTGFGASALLDFKLDLALDGEPLTEEERKAVLQASSGLVLLKGRWVEVDRDRLGQVLEHWRTLQRRADSAGLTLLDGLRLLSGFDPGGDASGSPDEEADRDEWSRITAGAWLAEALASVQGEAATAASDPGPALRATLRPYQRAGVHWLWGMHRLGVGACLADDMGLGKTVQIIALLLALRRGRPENAPQPAPRDPPSLLIVPASLLANWQNELARFAPDLRPRLLHPSVTPPEELAALASDPAAALAGCDLVIVTYGLALRYEWLRTIEWRALILDEAQAIKNAANKQTRAVKALRARHRLALTGTPIENRLSDLWSLFDFLNPGLLGGPTEFARFLQRQTKSDAGERRYASLRRLVRPLLLRRLKTDRAIISDLPDKTELDAFCPLAPAQAALYQEAVRELGGKLAEPGASGIQRRGLVLAFLTRFKQICNHPSQWLDDAAWAPDDSGKFGRLRELAEEIASRQEKMLVFTQYRTLAEPLARFLADIFGRSGLVLDGSTPIKERQRRVEEFQREEGPPFFVLSLKAGGTGLNLTAATHVIHFDRWWNPAVENQATDRAFRIGQKRNVMVHKFICRGTLEERIHALISEKIGLSDDILGDGPERLLTEMDNDELLRFVALDARAAEEE